MRARLWQILERRPVASSRDGIPLRSSAAQSGGTACAGLRWRTARLSVIKMRGSSRICARLDEVVPLLNESQCLVIAEEALLSSDRNEFAAWFENQPTWSDFPIVLLTMRGTEVDKRLAFLDRYLIVLERPFLASSLANSVRSAPQSAPARSQVIYRTEAGGFRPTAVADPGTASPRQEYAGQRDISGRWWFPGSCPAAWCSWAGTKPLASAPSIAVVSERLCGGHRRFPVGYISG